MLILDRIESLHARRVQNFSLSAVDLG